MRLLYSELSPEYTGYSRCFMYTFFTAELLSESLVAQTFMKHFAIFILYISNRHIGGGREITLLLFITTPHHDCRVKQSL